jgi:hypothetical protein
MRCSRILKSTVFDDPCRWIVAGLVLLISTACGPSKVVVYRNLNDFPPPVVLIQPSGDTLVTSNHPTFIWHRAGDATRYQIQVSSSEAFIDKSIDTFTNDTTYSIISSLADDTYYWRVRSCNTDNIWGNWADAEIRVFFKSDYADYIELLSQTLTYGSAQDVFVRGDTAYVADGQSDLTIYDVSNPHAPLLLRNVDTRDDDFAKGVYVPSDTAFPYVYVADMDGMIQSFSLVDTTGMSDARIMNDLNTEEVIGAMITDSLGESHLWIMAVSSGFAHRKLSYYQMNPAPGGSSFGYANSMAMPADAMGLCVDLNNIFIACGNLGIVVVDCSDPFNMIEISSVVLPGTALSIDIKDGLACVAGDRAGCNIVDVSNAYQPHLLKNVNTSGRSKDAQIVGRYVFVADGGSGLKVIDISIPDSAHVVATYPTPYAYGLWATENYIYLCDRDLGLMIFENRALF